jgi:hypothetical protein
VHWSREVAEENFHGVSGAMADGAWWLVPSEREHREQLCLAIVGPPRVRNHLLEGMRSTALHHTEMVGELAMFCARVSSAVELVLERSPDDTLRMEVLRELVAEFWRLEERCSWFEGPDVRICDLLL